MIRILAHPILNLLLWMAVTGSPQDANIDNGTDNHKVHLAEDTSLLDVHHYDVFKLQETGLRAENVANCLERHSVRAEVHDTDDLGYLEVALLKVLASHQCIVVACNVKWNDKIWKMVQGLDGFHTVQSWIFIQEQVSSQTLRQDTKIFNPQVTIMVPETVEVTKGVWTFSTKNIREPEWSARMNNANFGTKVEDCRKLFNNKPNFTIKYNIKNGVEDGLVNCSKVIIYDTFFSNLTKQTEILPVGEWTCGKAFCGVKFYGRVEKIDKIGRLRGRTFKTPTFHNPPAVSVDNSRSPPIIGGYFREVFDTLAQHLNFRPEISVEPPVFGTELDNGSYNGVIGILHRREADVAMIDLGMTANRFKVMRYTSPVLQSYVSIFFKTPSVETSWLAYLKPFGPRIWASITVTVVAALCVLAIIRDWSPCDNSSHSTELHSRAWWLLSGTFLDEALTTPTGLASKVVLGTCLMAIGFLVAPYTSTFTSFLAHKNLKIPFHTLEDVAANQDYIIVLIDGTYHHDAIKHSKSGALSDIWRRVEERHHQDTAENVEQGLTKMYRGKYVLVTSGPKIKCMLRNNCSVMWSKNSYMKEFNKLGVRADFPYYDLLSFTLLRFMETGLLDRWRSHYILENRVECSTVQKSASLRLDNVAFSFFILAAGVGSAYIALAIERMVTRNCPKPFYLTSR